jgi:hypothetical protein
MRTSESRIIAITMIREMSIIWGALQPILRNVCLETNCRSTTPLIVGFSALMPSRGS